ncbi:MAG: glycine cleavage system aminomethyltransferase GcvT [Pseudomonadota bacterium]
MSNAEHQNQPAQTPLYEMHLALGARMVPFAGYSMPIQYRQGILYEHGWCRDKAALFDVSHMGQLFLHGPNVTEALEQLCGADLCELAPGRQVYTQLLNEGGTIIDDLMVARPTADSQLAEGLMLVINAARKHEDLAILNTLTGLTIERFEDRAMLALQGPMASKALMQLHPDAGSMRFMDWAELVIDNVPVSLTRSGYTGEDGFELSIPASDAVAVAQRLLAMDEVEMAGLGARDTLRLEAGLCLYGQDIDVTTTPIEASLNWSIGKRRRSQGGFNGDALILHQMREGAPRKLVGLKPATRAPQRAGSQIMDATGREVGRITSGSFSPSIKAPIALGYVAREALEANLYVAERKGQAQIIKSKLPFVPHRYQR